jgi:hypothetical protein
MNSFVFGFDPMPEWFYGKDSMAAIRYAQYNTVAVVKTAHGEEIARPGDRITQTETGLLEVTHETVGKEIL